MPTLDDTIHGLSNFASYYPGEVISVTETLTTIYSIIQDLNKIKRGLEHYQESDQFLTYFGDLIDRLRIRLDKYLLYTNVRDSHGVSLANTAHAVLLALAELKPLNKEDPILLDMIPEEDRVFIANGQQFSLNNLLTYNRTRPRKTGEITGVRQFILNPITNIEFSVLDKEHLIQVAIQKSLITTAQATVFRSNNQLNNPAQSASSNPMALFHGTTPQERRENFLIGKYGKYGLKPSHLTELNQSVDSQAFEHLFRERHLTAEQVINEVKGLAFEQTQVLAKGVTKSEIQALTNGPTRREMFQGLVLLDILIHCREFGMTPSHLEGKIFPPDSFGHDLGKICLNLIVERHLTPTEALDEMEDLDLYQLSKLKKDVTKSEILTLCPPGSAAKERVRGLGLIDVLIACKKYGMSVDNIQGKNLSARDVPALEYLFTARAMNTEQVLQEVDGLSFEQMRRIAAGEIREDILNQSQPKL